MKETPSKGQTKEQNVLDSWIKLVDTTMAGYNAVPLAQMHTSATASPQLTTGAAQSEKEDPWLALIDQLWKTNPYSSMLPIDYGEIMRVFQQIWLDAFSNPARSLALYSDFIQKYTELVTTSTLRFWGLSKESEPVIGPEKGDKRFNAPDWQQNAVFDALKQSYLLIATTWLKAVGGIEGMDERQRHKLTFFLRQYLDAISPTNFAFTNPQVIHEIVATGGQNLVQGTQHLLRDIQAGQIKITDTDAFEVGKTLAITPGQIVYRNKLMELIQYAPTTEQVHSIPLLFVPPWVNKYYLLDLQPHNSFVKFLLDRGYTVFVISWKNPDASMEHVTFDDYASLGPLTALEVIKEITGSPKVNTIGFCIGGHLLATIPPYLAAKGDDTINSVTFTVTLADFEVEVNDLVMFLEEPTIQMAEQQLEGRAYLDSQSMMTMFEFLRANDLIWSNVVNNYLLGKEPSAFDVLFWNVDATRMSKDAHLFYMRNVCLANALAKPGSLVIKGVPIDLRNLKQDVYAVGTVQDHIVPWKSAWRMTELVGGKSRFVLGGSGHVAGVAAHPNSKPKGYWTNDKSSGSADEWLAGAERHEGSWWMDWMEWLGAHSGAKVAPPSMGSRIYPPLVPAPGTYVLEK